MEIDIEKLSLQLQDYVASLPKQIIFGVKDIEKDSGVTLNQIFYYDGCPLKTPRWSSKCRTNIVNIRMDYFQQQFIRFMSYFNEQFIWAFTTADPYIKYRTKLLEQKRLKEGNQLKDLEQLDLEMDFELLLEHSCIYLKERPYFDDKLLELQMNEVRMKMDQIKCIGKHSLQPKLEMKMNKMTYEVQQVEIYYLDKTGGSSEQNQRKLVSNKFNLDIVMMLPTYSELLEKINSKVLDKSTDLEVKIHPQVNINMSQDLYTYIVSMNQLNLAYRDQFIDHLNFSQVNEYFQSQDLILYMRTKIQIQDYFTFILEQDDKELVQIKLQSLLKSGMKSKPGFEDREMEIMKCELFLDQSMKIQMCMGVPSILNPPESLSNQPSQQSPEELQDQFAPQLRHLLFGPESEPHSDLFYSNADEECFQNNEDSETYQTNSQARSQEYRKPGKFLFKLNWAANGQQQLECKIDKVKMFIRPYYFMKLGHYFGYGYPQFDMTADDRPNDYETDLEKQPVQNMKLEILDSMICFDSFNPCIASNDFGSTFAGDLDEFMARTTIKLRDNGTIRGSVYGNESSRESGFPQKDATDGKTSKSMTTIVCKTDRIEYVSGRETIHHVKEQLYKKLKEFIDAQNLNKRQHDESDLAQEETKQEDLDTNNEVRPSEMSMKFNDTIDQRTASGINEKEPDALPESIEVERKNFMRMWLKIRQFSPYICDSLELDQFGFDDIQKRQLVSPMDLTFTHSKLLKVCFNETQPSRFIPFQNNDLIVAKTLLKLTFSDILVLQEASSILMESQDNYSKYLIDYLQNQKAKQQTVIQKRAPSNPNGQSTFSLASKRTKQRRSSHLSFLSALAPDNSQGSDQAEESDVKIEAQQVEKQMRNNLMTYMTGYTAQRNQSSHYKRLNSHNSSFSMRSRKNSGSVYNDALSRKLSNSSQDEMQRMFSTNTVFSKVKDIKVSASTDISLQHRKIVSVIREEEQIKEADAAAEEGLTTDRKKEDQVESALTQKSIAGDDESDLAFYSIKIPENEHQIDSSQSRLSSHSRFLSLQGQDLGDQSMKTALGLISNSDDHNSDQILSKSTSQQDDQSEGSTIIWEVDYGDDTNYGDIESRTSLDMSSVHVLVINDGSKVFYPILQMSIQRVLLVLNRKTDSVQGDTDIKMMISYYNNDLDVWEPFLEKTNMKVQISQDRFRTSTHIWFTTPVNLNVTDELVENIGTALVSLEKTKKENIVKNQSQSQVSRNTFQVERESQESTKQRGLTIRKGAVTDLDVQPQSALSGKGGYFHQQKRKNLEFKVTPYRIVNMTSKKLMVRRKIKENSKSSNSERKVSGGPNQIQNSSSKVKGSSKFQSHNKLKQKQQLIESEKNSLTIQKNTVKTIEMKSINDSHKKAQRNTNKSEIPNKYYINSGQSIDYEVDYEEEAQQLIRASTQDLVRKLDSIDIVFGDGKHRSDIIKGYNLASHDLHQHSFTSDPFNFIIFGMSTGVNKVEKSFTLRSPFIIFNRTENSYMLKIIKYQSNEEKVLELEPEEGYPLSYHEMKSKVMFTTLKDFLFAKNNPQQFSEKQDEIWSSHFKVSNFFQKNDISKKKFFVYHLQQFSMVFVQPAAFYPAWDICIKVPLILRNGLPFDLRIKTFKVLKYIQPRSMLLSSQKRKEIVYDQNPHEFVIPRQGKQLMHNFNIEGEIEFDLNFDILDDTSLEGEYLMEWCKFRLIRDEYKANEKIVTIVDKASGSTLEVAARIRSTAQTDLEITFYCHSYVVNNTNQNIVLFSADGKKQRLACQNSLINSIIPISANINKVMAGIVDGKTSKSQISSKHASGQFPVNVVGISNKVCIQKDKDCNFEFILNTEYSLVFPSDSLYTKVTVIDPQFVICNMSPYMLMVAQYGHQDKNVEIIKQDGRVPYYWNDIKDRQNLVFKIAQQKGDSFDENEFIWSKKVKPQKIGRISIICRNKKNVEESKHMVVIKQVNKDTQTIYLIFKMENHKYPTYQIENLSKQIQMEYVQQGISPSSDAWRETLVPGQKNLYSWTDPEKSKGKKLLTCNLSHVDPNTGKFQSMQKLEIDLDNLEYTQSFSGRFVCRTDTNPANAQKQTPKKGFLGRTIKAKKSENEGVSEVVTESIVKLQMVTDGYTKTLRLVEKQKNEIDHQQQSNFKIINNIRRNTRAVTQKSKNSKLKKSKNVNISVIVEDEDQEQEEEGDEDFQNDEECKIQTLDDHTKAPERESKLQLDVGMLYVSFISRNDKNVRREFVLGYMESIEFLRIESDQDLDYQLRVAQFQLDNNIDSEGRQLFPHILYAKEINQRASSFFNQQKKKGIRNQRKDFFNAHLCLKQNQNDLVFIHKFEWLLQSAILQMDDELYGWISKFIEKLSTNLMGEMSSVHVIFKQDQIQFCNNYLDQSQPFTVQNTPEIVSTSLNVPKLDLMQITSSSQMAFGNVGNSNRESGVQMARPDKKNGVKYKYSSFGGSENTSSVYAQISTNSWLNYDLNATANPVYIKELVMSPVDFELTYRTRGKTENDASEKEGPRNMRGLKLAGLSLANFEKAPFKLNSLVLSNVFGTPAEIQSIMYANYRQKFVKNFVILVSSSNLLLGMNLLAYDVGTGVKDFFYRPMEGFVDGPIEGGKGIFIGTGSLIGNTAKGAFGTVSRLMNTVSKSLLFLAGDEDYIDQREKEAVDKPTNAYQGLKKGLKSGGQGIASGVKGMFEQPIKGAKEAGAKGLVRGTVKGVGGMIFKPLSGGLDVIMKTTEGAQNMVKVGGKGKKLNTRNQLSGTQNSILNDRDQDQNIELDSDENDQSLDQEMVQNGSTVTQTHMATTVQKIRAFRPFYGKSQRIKAYHEFQAYVALNLKIICNGNYANDHFLDAIVYDSQDLKLCIILTEERLLIVDALTKEMKHDFTADMLAKVETRTKFTYVTQPQHLAIENDSQDNPQPQVDIGKTVGIKSNFLVIKVYEEVEIDDFIAIPGRLDILIDKIEEQEQIDSSSSIRKSPSQDTDDKVQQDPSQSNENQNTGQQPSKVNFGERRLVDGIALEIKNSQKLKEYVARLEHFIWFVKHKNTSDKPSQDQEKQSRESQSGTNRQSN